MRVFRALVLACALFAVTAMATEEMEMPPEEMHEHDDEMHDPMDGEEPPMDEEWPPAGMEDEEVLKSSKEVFGDLDENKDGKVSHEEFLERLKKVHKLEAAQNSAEASSPTDEELATMAENPEEHQTQEFSDMDKDGDGLVNLTELLQMFYPEPEPESTEDRTAEDIEEEKRMMEKMRTVETLRFKKADHNNDEKMDIKEFVYWQNKHFPELDEMMMDPEGDVKRHMKDLDTDGDGTLDEAEIETGHDWLVHITHPPYLKTEL